MVMACFNGCLILHIVSQVRDFREVARRNDLKLSGVAMHSEDLLTLRLVMPLLYLNFRTVKFLNLRMFNIFLNLLPSLHCRYSGCFLLLFGITMKL
jgi:hypothetical protein